MSRPHSIKQIAEALRRTSGQPVLAGKLLGVTRQAIHERIKRSKALQDVMGEIDDAIISKAQDNIGQAIESGDAATSRWLLERRGRHLGYGNKTDISVDTGQIEKIAQAIAAGGVVAIRAVQAALASSR